MTRPARRALPYLLALGLALVGILALVPRPASGPAQPRAQHVVLVGAPGLRWDDVSPTEMPRLWALAARGTIGALAVRSARRVTCPVDGWLTLGAGNYARSTTQQVTGPCPLDYPGIERTEAGAKLREDHHAAIAEANRTLPSDVELGALSESVRCTAAVGPGAAVAAARPFGRVGRYAPEIGDDLDDLLASCALSFVDIGTVVGDGTPRIVTARRADAALATVLAARPAGSLVLVAGLADTEQAARLHVVVAEGPGFGPGWLSSPSTGREGYVRLIDLAPTALTALGRQSPPRLFAGAAAMQGRGRPPGLAAAVDRLADADRVAGAQRRVSTWFFAVLAAGQVLLFAGLVPLLRRARRPAGPAAAPPVPPRLIGVVESLLIAAALAVPAAMVANVVPWWRFTLAGPVFAALVIAVLAAATALVHYGASRYRALGPLGGVSAAAAIVVALDVLTGARLQLNGVTGYSALAGGRYAGIGAIGLGTFMAGVLLSAGCLAQRIDRRWRPVLVAALGSAGVVLVGSPYLGADAAGAVALTAGVCAAAAMSTGGWLSFPRLAWAVLAALGTTTAFALLDLRRPAEERGSVGRFLGHLGDGTAALVISRAGGSSIVTLVTSPLTVLVLFAAAVTGLVLVRPWGGLRRLFGLFPAVRGALAGLVVASVLAGVLEGVGLNVAGAALAIVVPLTALAALRVQHHADDRTQPVRVGPAVPEQTPVG